MSLVNRESQSGKIQEEVFEKYVTFVASVRSKDW